MLKKNLKFLLFSNILMILQIRGGTCAAGTRSGVLPEPRIINGTNANLNSARHQVSLRYREDENNKFGSGHKCGGSLISNNVVLTAAHCLLNTSFKYYDNKDLVVVMGNLNRFKKNNNTLVYDILKTVKGSLNVKFDEDIALIILNGTVPSNHPTVQPITLNEAVVKNNTLCQVTGWGITEKKDLSTMLKIVDLPIIDFNDCRNKTEYGARVREGMLCAGYLEGGRDACTADSGGPLVCHGRQVGIVSWGSNCGVPLNPGVYTNVTFYKNWIIKQVTVHNASLPKFSDVTGGVTSLKCSLIIISLLLILNFTHVHIINA